MEKLTEDQIYKHLENVEGWDYYDDAIHTTFEFDNFMDAFSVMTRIALIAEKMEHHPDCHNVYNTLEISLSTHDVNGLTENDFKLAAAIEHIVGDE